MVGKGRVLRQAPEFSQIKGWLNSPPLTVAGLRGKVVLLDFWTYSCVNCVRTLPHMKSLHDKYSSDSFVLVGVHTPEFQFERSPENVAAAVKRFNIKYPVALDSDNSTWRLYGNQYWPRQTLVDAKGRIRWEHAGEGDYDEMERQVRKLLDETGRTVTGKVDEKRIGLDTAVDFRGITPEIYLGSLRSKGFGNGQVLVPGSCTRFIDPNEHEQDLVYLDGDWTQLPECILHATTEPGYAVLRYRARNANAVLGVVNNNSVRVQVELDGRSVEPTRAGRDLRVDAEGSFLLVSEHRLFDIIRSAELETHDLRLTTNDGSLCVYTYTFG